MWEEILVSASCLSAIILTLVGLAKMPFKKLKESHKGWYRAIFFVLSLALVVSGSIITELYIVNGALLSVEFACLILGTAFGVFGGYAAYENLPIKSLMNKGFTALGKLLNSYSDSKVAKMIGKVGMDKINEIAEKQNQKDQPMELTEVVIPVDQDTITSTNEDVSVVIEEKKEEGV